MLDTTEIQALDDAELVCQAIIADLARSDYDDELQLPEPQVDFDLARAECDRRFGEGALDRTGDWFTATKADPTDILYWARERADRVVQIAQGHDCDNQSVDRNGTCWCGRTWAKMANRNSWYDPTEGTDPSV